VSSHKPNLEAFADRKEVIYVITTFNAIEENLASLLIREIGAPKAKEQFLRDILFNNAILPFSSKVRLFLHLRAANNWPRIDPSKFHRLMHIRNQFAHSRQTIHATLEMDNEMKNCAVVDQKIMISSVTGSGQLVAVSIQDALNEFTNLYVEISSYLHKLAMQT
jgi:hypothetical protein